MDGWKGMGLCEDERRSHTSSWDGSPWNVVIDCAAQGLHL